MGGWTGGLSSFGIGVSRVYLGVHYLTDVLAGTHAAVNAVSLYVERGQETFHSVHVEAAERVAAGDWPGAADVYATVLERLAGEFPTALWHAPDGRSRRGGVVGLPVLRHDDRCLIQRRVGAADSGDVDIGRLRAEREARKRGEVEPHVPRRARPARLGSASSSP